MVDFTFFRIREPNHDLGHILRRQINLCVSRTVFLLRLSIIEHRHISFRGGLRMNHTL